MAQPHTTDLCVALANHWSYTGIGWQLGLESCAQSITDSLAMADYEPSVKTGLNLDALAYEMVAEKYPEVIERLKKALDAGRVEIIGGTFGQPMGSMVSGESNLRQLVVGQETIRRAVGRGVTVFLEEEEMSHPQIPQLVKLAGYKYASLAQCDTWGKHGAPKIEKNVIRWEGVDGTRVVATPVNALVFHPPAVTHDIDWLWSDAGRAKVDAMKHFGEPGLAIKWTEFGWESLTGKSMNKFDPELFKTLSKNFRVEYVTIEQYLDRHGQNGADLVHLKMDDFAKLLPWGVGGDQIRRFGREVEAVLLAAESFEAAAHALGLSSSSPHGRGREGGSSVIPARSAPLPTSPEGEGKELDQAWRDLLASQSHDVSLCEYSRWNGGSMPPPRESMIPAHFLTWGAMGYRHMDRAMELGAPVLERSIAAIAGAVDTGEKVDSGVPLVASSRPVSSEAKEHWSAKKPTSGTAPFAIVAFNPCGFDRDAVAATGKVLLTSRGARGLRVCDSDGKEIPWQILDHSHDKNGDLVHVNVAFRAKQLPGFGYDTFALETSDKPTEPPATDLRINPDKLELENELIKVTLDPVSGAIASLVDRRTGKNLLDARRAFPTLTGKTNPAVLPARHATWGPIPEAYDSSKSQAEITWIEKGPLRATVRASHPLVRGMRFEVYTTLSAGSPSVHVHARFFPDMPPAPPQGRMDTWQLDLDMDDGYWLEFTPAFKPATVIRDYPFGVEPCAKKTIDALTFLDLVDADGAGLLIAHSGSQYFKRRDDGIIANLVVREWESHFTAEHGYPRVCEYRYTLTPHGPTFTNANRLRPAMELDQKPRCVVLPPKKGTLPRRQSFVRVEGDGVMLSAFRRRGGDAYELRAVECEGAKPQVKVSTSLPLTQMRPTNALGEPAGEPAAFNNSFAISFRGWEVKNMELKK